MHSFSTHVFLHLVAHMHALSYYKHEGLSQRVLATQYYCFGPVTKEGIQFENNQRQVVLTVKRLISYSLVRIVPDQLSSTASFTVILQLTTQCEVNCMQSSYMQLCYIMAMTSCSQDH